MTKLATEPAAPGYVPGTRRAGAPSRGRARRAARWKLGTIAWAFALPALGLALLFKFIPIFDSLTYSFQKVQPFLGNEFVGLDNYIRVLTDEKFQLAALHTVQIAFFQTLGGVAVGLGLALLLEGQARSLWFVRTAVFLPVVAAVAVVAEAWRSLLYPSELGFVNSLLGLVGIPAQEFLNSPDTAIWTIIFIGVWSGAPYNMVIFVAGLTGIEREMYEASALDGASRWQRLWYIVVPSLRASFAIVLTLAAIRALRVFTEVYVLTGGGPAGSTDVWMTRMYSAGTIGNDVGLSSAAAIILLVVIGGLTAFTQYVTRRRQDA